MSGASQHEQSPTSWSVIVLTGGASTRMGRDKATLTVEGQTLLERTLSGVPDAVPVFVSGPAVPLTRSGVQFTREDPPGGGPVAGVDAALTRVTTEVAVVLATDLPSSASCPTLSRTSCSAPRRQSMPSWQSMPKGAPNNCVPPTGQMLCVARSLLAARRPVPRCVA